MAREARGDSGPLGGGCGGTKEGLRGRTARALRALALRTPHRPPGAGSVLRSRGSRPRAAWLCGAGDRVWPPQRAFPANEAACVFSGAPRAGRGRALAAPWELGGAGRAGGPPPPGSGIAGTPDSVEGRRRKGHSCPTLASPALPLLTDWPHGRLERGKFSHTDKAYSATPCCFVCCETQCANKVLLLIVNLRTDYLVGSLAGWSMSVPQL